MKKIGLVGIYFPLAILRYFENALKQTDGIELVTIGPYTGGWIPWAGGITSLPKYAAKAPTVPLDKNLIGVGKISPKVLSMYPQVADIDVWIMVDAGFRLSERPPYGKVIHVQTDPHVLKGLYRQVDFADYKFCMQTPYMEDGEIYLPYAFDSSVHFPMEVNKVYDAALVGLHYDNRTWWVNELRRRGLEVYYDLGPMYDEYRMICNRSKIGLNWSSMLDMVARVWEYAGMRIPMVTNRVPDMSKFFVEDEDYLGFDTKEEAVDQVLRLYKDEDLQIKLAKNAQNKAKGNTYKDRIDYIFEVCGI